MVRQVRTHGGEGTSNRGKVETPRGSCNGTNSLVHLTTIANLLARPSTSFELIPLAKESLGEAVNQRSVEML
jgi:hypothetical protein